jgi:hypothetical protein
MDQEIACIALIQLFCRNMGVLDQQFELRMHVGNSITSREIPKGYTPSSRTIAISFALQDFNGCDQLPSDIPG